MSQWAIWRLLLLFMWGGIAGCVVNPAFGQAVFPTDVDMQAARKRMAAALAGTATPLTTSNSSVPDIKSLPKPAGRSPDIAKIAEAFRQPAPNNLSAPLADIPELMVFVSFSLPKETLQRIVSQSEKSGAVLVLRGLKGNSLTQMGGEIASLVGDRNVTAIIHPPAFKQFDVKRVPSMVLARSGQASKISEDGCSPATSFIKVDGDVTQEYALDLIEREAPAWAEAAHRFASKLSGQQP